MRKVLAVWQMIIFIVLLLGVVGSMFIPVFVFDGEKMVSAVIDAAVQPGMDREDIEEAGKKLDDEIEELEKKHGVSIASISGWKFLTMPGIDGFQSEEASKFETFITVMRVLLWIICIGAVIFLILTILNFCIHWSKYICLICNIVYSVFGAVCFGYFEWLIPGRIVDLVSEMREEMSYGTMYASIIKDACWGWGFLITFIIFAVILVFSIVSLFVGQTREMVYGYGQTDFSGIPLPDSPVGMQGMGVPPVMPQGMGVPPAAPQGMEVPSFAPPDLEGESVTEPAPSLFPPLPPQQKQKQMGRVQCIAGVMMGNGYRLPEENKIIVGKDPMRSTLVINDQYVSGVHCSIQYNAARNMYSVQDYSSNGTFVGGMRMTQNVPVEYPAGTVLILADGKNQIKLG